jgi:predicted Fe-Mo cluster-binding NifX family protein
MRIAISSYGADWQARVDERFGRAKGFFIYDTETQKTSYIENRAGMNAAHGAGTKTAQLIADAGVAVVITGAIGPKAGSVLKAAGVTVMTVANFATVEQACQLFQDGKLSEMNL